MTIFYPGPGRCEGEGPGPGIRPDDRGADGGDKVRFFPVKKNQAALKMIVENVFFRMERTYLDEMGNRRVLDPDLDVSTKHLRMGPSYQYS